MAFNGSTSLTDGATRRPLLAGYVPPQLIQRSDGAADRSRNTVAVAPLQRCEAIRTPIFVPKKQPLPNSQAPSKGYEAIRTPIFLSQKQPLPNSQAPSNNYENPPVPVYHAQMQPPSFQIHHRETVSNNCDIMSDSDLSVFRHNVTSPTTNRSRSPPPDFSEPPVWDTASHASDTAHRPRSHSIERYMTSIATDPPNIQEPLFRDMACDTSDNLSDSDLSVLRHNVTSPTTNRSRTPPPDFSEPPIRETSRTQTSSTTASGTGVLIRIGGSPTEIAVSIAIVLAAVWIFFGPFSSSSAPVCQGEIKVPPSGGFGFVSFIITFVVMFVAAALIAA